MADPGTRHVIVVVEQAASRVGFYDSLDGSKLGEVAVGFWPHEVILSHDGKTAYVSNFGLQDYDERIGDPGSSISIIDISHMCEKGRLYTFNTDTGEVYQAPHGMKLHPRDSKLFVGVEKGYAILIFDLNDTKQKCFCQAFPGRPHGSDEQVVATLVHPVPDDTHNMMFSPDGEVLWLMSGPHGIYRMNPHTGALAWQIGTLSPVRGLEYTPDNRYLMASGKNEIMLFDPEDYRLAKHFKNLRVGQLLYSVATSDGRYILAPAVWDSQLLIIDAKAHDPENAVRHRLVTGIDPVHVALSPDGTTAYVTNARSSYITTIDLRSLDESVIKQGRIANVAGPNGIVTCQHNPDALRRIQRKTLTFGAVLPLSGSERVAGREVYIGYEFWKESVNAAGGLLIQDDVYLIDTVYSDNQSDNTKTAELTRQLLIHRDVHFLLGSYPTSANLAASEVAKEQRVPMVTASGAGRVIYEKNNPYIFGIMSPAGAYLRGSIEVAILQEPQPETTVILSCDDHGALEDAQDTAQFALSKGLKILSPSELPSGFHERSGIVVYNHAQTQDFRPVLRTLKALGADFFIGAGHLSESEAIVKAAAEVDFTAMGFTFSVGPSLPEFTSTLGALAQHMMGATQWTPEVTLRGYDMFMTAKNFANVFSQRYHMPASYLSAGAVACGEIFCDALRAVDSIGREAVRKALAATDTATFFGHIKLNEKGLNANKPMVTIQLTQQGDTWERTVLWPKVWAGANKPVWPFPGWPKRIR